MISFDKWYEKAEDKLLEEYEAKKSPIDWDEFVLGKFEEFTSEMECRAYDDWKDNRWDMKFQINLIKKFMLKTSTVMKIVKLG